MNPLSSIGLAVKPTVSLATTIAALGIVGHALAGNNFPSWLTHIGVAVLAAVLGALHQPGIPPAPAASAGPSDNPTV